MKILMTGSTQLFRNAFTSRLQALAYDLALWLATSAAVPTGVAELGGVNASGNRLLGLLDRLTAARSQP